MRRVFDSDRREVQVLEADDFPVLLAQHLETALERPLRNAIARQTWKLLLALVCMGGAAIVAASRWTKGVEDQLVAAAEDRQIDSLARVVDRQADAVAQVGQITLGQIGQITQQLSEIRVLLLRRPRPLAALPTPIPGTTPP